MFDLWYNNFGILQKTSLAAIGYFIYRTIYIKTQFKEDEFNKIEDITNLVYPELTSQETISFKKCGRFLADLKTRLSSENATKLHGFNYISDNNNQGIFSFHSNCGVTNLNYQNISTDRHGIIISKNLLTLLNDKELKAILSHEVGHIALNHVTQYKNFLREACQLSFQLGLIAIVSSLEFIITANLFGYKNNVEFAKIVMVIITMIAINHYTKIEIRKDEFDADKKSVIYTADKINLISAIKKIQVSQTLDELPTPSNTTFFKPNKNNDYEFLMTTPKPPALQFLALCIEYYTKFSKSTQLLIAPYAPYFSTHPTIDEREKNLDKLEIPFLH